MTDVRTPDPAKASPPGPPDRELREQLTEIYIEVARQFYFEGSTEEDERARYAPDFVDQIMALIAKDRTAHVGSVGEPSVIASSSVDCRCCHMVNSISTYLNPDTLCKNCASNHKETAAALLQRVQEEVIGPDTHTPLLEDRPNGPHVMETEKNELRAAQRKVLDNIIGGKK